MVVRWQNVLSLLDNRQLDKHTREHISKFRNIRKRGTYKCNDKRCKICQNYSNETNKFTISNGQLWEIRREIDCHSVNAVCYLKCKVCNEKETYIGKTIGDDTKGFKVRVNQHISDCKIKISTCKFLRHVCDCGIKNKCLKEPFFSLNIMLRLNKSDRLEAIKKHPEPRKDFETFCQRMRLKWHIKDEPTSSSGETINFRTKVSSKL